MSVLRHDDDSVDDRVYAVDEKRAGLRSAQSSEERRDSSDACQKQNEAKDEEDCRSYKSQLSATSKAVPANSVNSCSSTHRATIHNDKSKPTTLPSHGSKTTRAKSNRSVLGIDKTALPPPPPPPPSE
ncbi:uncharacterized protein LOC143470534 [Clavelina lepadiformis]|uniref:uncharacterized protein LOC143470534 n=1 Tax=Clavelina lepadiformis TaxID=159417 RepID=UPI00404105C1